MVWAIGSTIAVTAAGGCASRSKAYAEVEVVSGAGNRGQSNDALVAAAQEAVAVVETPTGRGLGFVIDPRGYVLTNRHVIEDASHVESISFPAHDPPASYSSVQIIYMDPARDLALLKVNTPQPLPSLSLATHKPQTASRYIRPNDPVLLLEYDHDEPEQPPVAGTPTLGPRSHFVAHNASVTTLGVVNAAAGPGSFVGVDADVKRGQSGGPVLDRSGRVVGIVTWTWRDHVGGFAIPIGDAMQMLEERPALDSNDQHRDRIAKRSREFLTALGRGELDDARRLTSPSHARQVRAASVDKITAKLDGEGAPVIEGFFAAVESLVDQEDVAFELLRELVTRTATPEFRDALGMSNELDDDQIISFFFELGQAYLIGRMVGELSPQDALQKSLHHLQTVDAARTFALADTLTELAGSEVRIQKVEVVPGAYTPTAVVSLARDNAPLSERMGRRDPRIGRGRRLTLHMKLEWGDWYVASVGPTPLSDRAG